VAATCRELKAIVSTSLSWQGSSLSLGHLDIATEELFATHIDRPEVVRLRRQVREFPVNVGGLARAAAALAMHPRAALRSVQDTGLYVQGWATSERHGLAPLASGFPSLLHLELSDCDPISDYDMLLPVLWAHPQLQSLRCCFNPSRAAPMDIADALPQGLMALGYVSFETEDVLSALIQRCASLEHLWLSAGSLEHRGTLTRGLARALSEATTLRTLCLPLYSPEDRVLALTSRMPKLELMGCLRRHFGTKELAQDWEVLPDTGSILKRRGSSAKMACNGALWAPYSERMAPMQPVTPVGNRYSAGQCLVDW
jgi:hypothetical protein